MATPELLELEAKRADLIGKYKPDSERVKAIDSQIERLRKAISGYDTVHRARRRARATRPAPTWSPARAALAALKGREDALAKAADEYRKQAEFLDSQSFDLARLERQVKLDEETYTSYVRSAEQSRLSNALEQSKLLRLRIIEPAALPLAGGRAQEGPDPLVRAARRAAAEPRVSAWRATTSTPRSRAAPTSAATPTSTRW